MTIPKVSCLCLTRGRPKRLHRVIKCFQRQTWQNRELVIVYDFDDKRTTRLLEHFKNEHNIKCVKNIKKKPSVGYLRNLSVESATGKFVIQWDDDDFYTKDRIAFMMKKRAEGNKPAIVLNTWFCFFVKKNVIRKANRYTYEGSLLAKKELLQKFKYPDYTRKKVGNTEIGEDTHVIRKIKANNLLHVVHKPDIYYYFIHGNNTCSPEHFKRMFRNSKPINNAERTRDNLVKILSKDDEEYSKLISN